MIDGGRAAGHDGPRELGRRHERALDVNVGVDEAGRDERAGEIDFLPRRGSPRGRRCVASHGDAGRLDLAAEDVDDPRVLQQQVGRLVTPGVADQGLQVHGRLLRIPVPRIIGIRYSENARAKSYWAACPQSARAAESFTSAGHESTIPCRFTSFM